MGKEGSVAPAMGSRGAGGTRGPQAGLNLGRCGGGGRGTSSPRLGFALYSFTRESFPFIYLIFSHMNFVSFSGYHLPQGLRVFNVRKYINEIFLTGQVSC